MPQLDRFQQAAFRDVPFHVRRLDTSLGRSTVRHEVMHSRPEQGDRRTIIEDTGVRPRVFSVTAVVFGENADLVGNQLHDALELGGDGVFVHPWLGRTLVTVVGDSSRGESAEVAGAVEFTFELEEVSEQLLPHRASPTHAEENVDQAGAATRAVAEGEAEEQVATTGWPEYVRQATVGATEQVGAIFAGLRFVKAEADKVAGFTQQVVDLVNLASSLATAPAELAVRILDAVEQIGDAGMAFRDSFYVYRTIFGSTPEQHGGASAAAQAADRNARVVIDLLRVGALYSSASAAARADWASASEAERARVDLNAELDDLQARASDELFGALADLRVEIDRALPGTINRREDRRTIELGMPLPALVLAHRYHGDAARDEEIVSQNAVVHPLFVPAGRPLSIAIDG